MSRQTLLTELINEDSAVASPRRSTRIAAVIVRRASTDSNPSQSAKITRSKRLSVSQDDNADAVSISSNASSIDEKSQPGDVKIKSTPTRRTRSKGSTDDEGSTNVIPARITRRSSNRSISCSPTNEQESTAKSSTPRRSTRAMSASPIIKVGSTKVKGQIASAPNLDAVSETESMSKQDLVALSQTDDEDKTESTENKDEEEATDKNLPFKKKKAVLTKKQNLDTIIEKSFIDENEPGQIDKSNNDINELLTNSTKSPTNIRELKVVINAITETPKKIKNDLSTKTSTNDNTVEQKSQSDNQVEILEDKQENTLNVISSGNTPHKNNLEEISKIPDLLESTSNKSLLVTSTPTTINESHDPNSKDPKNNDLRFDEPMEVDSDDSVIILEVTEQAEEQQTLKKKTKSVDKASTVSQNQSSLEVTEQAEKQQTLEKKTKSVDKASTVPQNQPSLKVTEQAEKQKTLEKKTKSVDKASTVSQNQSSLEVTEQAEKQQTLEKKTKSVDKASTVPQNQPSLKVTEQAEKQQTLEKKMKSVDKISTVPQNQPLLEVTEQAEKQQTLEKKTKSVDKASTVPQNQQSLKVTDQAGKQQTLEKKTKSVDKTSIVPQNQPSLEVTEQAERQQTLENKMESVDKVSNVPQNQPSLEVTEQAEKQNILEKKTKSVDKASTVLQNQPSLKVTEQVKIQQTLEKKTKSVDKTSTVPQNQPSLKVTDQAEKQQTLEKKTKSVDKTLIVPQNQPSLEVTEQAEKQQTLEKKTKSVDKASTVLQNQPSLKVTEQVKIQQTLEKKTKSVDKTSTVPQNQPSLKVTDQAEKQQTLEKKTKSADKTLIVPQNQPSLEVTEQAEKQQTLEKKTKSVDKASTVLQNQPSLKVTEQVKIQQTLEKKTKSVDKTSTVPQNQPSLKVTDQAEKQQTLEKKTKSIDKTLIVPQNQPLLEVTEQAEKQNILEKKRKSVDKTSIVPQNQPSLEITEQAEKPQILEKKRKSMDKVSNVLHNSQENLQPVVIIEYNIDAVINDKKSPLKVHSKLDKSVKHVNSTHDSKEIVSNEKNPTEEQIKQADVSTKEVLNLTQDENCMEEIGEINKESSSENLSKDENKEVEVLTTIDLTQNVDELSKKSPGKNISKEKNKRDESMDDDSEEIVKEENVSKTKDQNRKVDGGNLINDKDDLEQTVVNKEKSPKDCVSTEDTLNLTQDVNDSGEIVNSTQSSFGNLSEDQDENAEESTKIDSTQNTVSSETTPNISSKHQIKKLDTSAQDIDDFPSLILDKSPDYTLQCPIMRISDSPTDKKTKGTTNSSPSLNKDDEIIVEPCSLSKESKVTENDQCETSTQINKIAADINKKIDQLVLNQLNDVSSSDESVTHFLDDMAEEGEEDTTSEGSNDIIDEGESVGSTISDIDSDESYELDSFIDDDEAAELLSGEEYDLGQEKNLPKKKKRIIPIDDSSDEQEMNSTFKKTVGESVADKDVKISATKKDEDHNESDIENMSIRPYCGLTPPSIISVRQSLSGSENDEQINNEILINKDDNLKSLEAIKQQRNSDTFEKNELSTKVENELPIQQQSQQTINIPVSTAEPATTPNNSLSNVEISPEKCSSKKLSLTIQENINVKDIKSNNVNKCISNVLAAFYANVSKEDKNLNGSVVLNISVDYLESSTQNQEEKINEEQEINKSESILTEINVEPSETCVKKYVEKNQLDKSKSKRKQKKRKYTIEDERTDQLVQQNENDELKIDKQSEIKKCKKRKVLKITSPKVVRNNNDANKKERNNVNLKSDMKISKDDKNVSKKKKRTVNSKSDLETSTYSDEEKKIPLQSIKYKNTPPPENKMNVAQKKCKISKRHTKPARASGDSETSDNTIKQNSKSIQKAHFKVDTDKRKRIAKLKEKELKSVKPDNKIEDEENNKPKKLKIETKSPWDVTNINAIIVPSKSRKIRSEQQKSSNIALPSHILQQISYNEKKLVQNIVDPTQSTSGEQRPSRKRLLLPSTSTGKTSWESITINSPIKPSASLKMSKLKKNKKVVNYVDMFQEKDFKNRTLYDSSRVRREDTKIFLKKKQKLN